MAPASPEPSLAPDLWRRIAASDQQALAELHRATCDGLVRYATGLVRDLAVARDVVQEAFIRFWNHRADLDLAGSPRALLFRTVRNLAFNHFRDERTRARLLADHYEPTTWRDPGPLATTVANELAARLRLWIDALPERQREVLMLSRFQGLSHQEIATVLGVAPRTVNNHLVRALEAIRDRLDADAATEEVA